jgi:predicted metal-binding protein
MYTECKANALLYSTTFVRNVFCLKKCERATRRNARRSSYKACYLSSNFDRNWNCVKILTKRLYIQFVDGKMMLRMM